MLLESCKVVNIRQKENYYLYTFTINLNFSKGKEWEREQYAELLHRIYNKLYIKGYKVAVWSILSKISYSNLSSKDCDYDKIISRLHCHGSIVGYSLKDMNEVSEIIREETEEYYKNVLNGKVDNRLILIKGYNPANNDREEWKKKESYDQMYSLEYQQKQKLGNAILFSRIDAIKDSRDFLRYIKPNSRNTMINQREPITEKIFGIWERKYKTAIRNLRNFYTSLQDKSKLEAILNNAENSFSRVIKSDFAIS